MRRRWLGIFAKSLVVALLAAVVGMWVRGYRTADAVIWQRWHNEGGSYLGVFYTVLCGRGVIGVEVTELTTGFTATSVDPPRLDWTSRPAEQFRLPRDTFWRNVGFGIVSESQSTIGLRNSTLTRNVYWFPYWLVALPLALVPLGMLLALAKRRRRRRRGLCPACGYDVRFSAARCPECGAVIPPSPRDSAPRRSTSAPTTSAPPPPSPPAG